MGQNMILYYAGGGGGVWRGAKLYYIIVEWPLIKASYEICVKCRISGRSPVSAKRSNFIFHSGTIYFRIVTIFSNSGRKSVTPGTSVSEGYLGTNLRAVLGVIDIPRRCVQ